MGNSVSLRVFIVRNGTVIGGEGLVEMLKAVDRHGSIRLAAQSMGMNYKRFWLKLSNAKDSSALSQSAGVDGERAPG